MLAAKNVILNAVFDKQGYLLPLLFDEDYSHEMRSQMRLIVDNLFRKQLARKTSRGILISEQGLAEVGRRIRKHNEAVENRNAKPEPEAAVVDAGAAADSLEAAAVPGEAAVRIGGEDRPAAKTVAAQPGAAASGSEVFDQAEANAAQRPRRRRPVVVRPNFRREI